MSTILNAGRPFTEAIKDVRGDYNYTFQELSHRACGVRSSAWFHKQLSRDALVNSPPTDQEAWSGFAQLLSTDEAHVREMIAEEWLGVRKMGTSERVNSQAVRLDNLTDDSYKLVDKLLPMLPQQPRAPKRPLGHPFDHQVSDVID